MPHLLTIRSYIENSFNKLMANLEPLKDIDIITLIVDTNGAYHTIKRRKKDGKLTIDGFEIFWDRQIPKYVFVVPYLDKILVLDCRGATPELLSLPYKGMYDISTIIEHFKKEEEDK